MNMNARDVLEEIVRQFKSGNIPGVVALSMFPDISTPSANWSFRNRVIIMMSGTQDARGFRQWQEVNRHVKKGARAIHILVPLIGKKEDSEEPSLKGFKCSPVFRYEDTEGEPLLKEHEVIKNLPLYERAVEWGISVEAMPPNGRYEGCYRQASDEIMLATPEESVFFHELAHASHKRILGKLRGGVQDPVQEIVAELSAEALCRLVGRRLKDTTGNSYRYIEAYAKKINMSAGAAAMLVLDETEKVLNLILKGGEAVEQSCAV